jgi:predicted metal-dependent hydrolase
MKAVAKPALSRENKWRDAEEMKSAARDWASRIGVPLIQTQARPMKNKWASISTAGRLTLNTELLTLPKELSDFVIVHELVHLLAPNHGKVFKSFMHAYLPDWEELELRLQTLNDIKTPTK